MRRHPIAPRLAGALALAAALAAPPAGAQVFGVAARVNGAEITNERLDLFFEAYAAGKGRSVASFRSPAAYKRWKREALDVLIDEELLWQESQRRHIDVSPEELASAVAAERARFPSAEAFARQLARSGLSEERLPAFLRRQLAIDKLLRAGFTPRQEVTDAEVHQYYEENRERLAAAGGPATEQEAAAAVRRQLLDEKTRRAIGERLDSLRRSGKIEILIPL